MITTTRIGAFSACLVAATAFVGTAKAERELPWASGQGVVSAFEAHAAVIVSKLAEREGMAVICNGNTDWGILAAEGKFDPSQVWGYVIRRFSWKTFRWEPLPYTHASEAACLYADRFWAAPDKTLVKNCRTGANPIFEDREIKKNRTVWRNVTKRVAGKIKTVRVRRKETYTQVIRVKVGEEPVFTVCPDWHKTLFALQVFAHEPMHLFGISDESVAECYAMQLLPQVAHHFGATWEFAREIATDFAARWYTAARGEYWRADCVDGGPLDLYPGSSSWPAGY